jgi:hypothetical protein
LTTIVFKQLLLLASLCFSLLCIADESSSKNQTVSDINSLNEADRKSAFMAKVLEIANSGKVFEPAEMSRILDIALEVSKKVEEYDCKPPHNYYEFIETSKSITTENSWYKAQASGSYFYSGAPSIQHTITRIKQCYDNPVRAQLTDHTYASLEFYGLGNFSCISTDDIEKLIPNIKIRSKNYYSADAFTNNEVGTHLNFYFSRDWCATSIGIQQNQNYGWKYIRADQKYTACKNNVQKEYCTSHADVTWQKWNEANELAEKTCGTFNSLYVSEPAYGAPQVDSARIFKPNPYILKPPCERFLAK